MNLSLPEKKTALITGITGQDGSYLAEFLLEKGYRVAGMVRRTSTSPYENIKHILDKIEILDGDLLDLSSITRIIKNVRPNEVYNLAAQSFVGSSWDMPLYIGNVDALGASRVLEAILQTDKSIKFYQASSSEMFGGFKSTCPQNEKTPFYPRSPYGVAKVYAHHATINYRESFGLFACSGILFNHESPRRGMEFVTRKIACAVAKIAHSSQSYVHGKPPSLAPKLVLGNLFAERDWGFAGDYVKAMWLMLQHETPMDFVIGTGTLHSVEDFVKAAFEVVGIHDWWHWVNISKKFMRPNEVDHLLADNLNAFRHLGWKPEMTFGKLVETMVLSEIDRLSV